MRVCRLCKSEKVIIHQAFKKDIQDSVLTEAKVVRLKCKECKYSFRTYPEGVRDYSSRTKRLVFLGVVLYSAGLSYEKAAGFLSGMLGREVESFVTIWRDIQALGERLRRARTPKASQRLVVGLDATYVRVSGREQPVLVAVNQRDGLTISVDLGDEWKERELKEFLREVAKKVGLKNVSGLVTDDLDTYKLVSEKFKLPHQICLGHVKRNLARRLAKLAGKIPKAYTATLTNILDPPALEGEQTLRSLLGKPDLWKAGKRNKHWIAYRMVVADLLRNWKNYTAHLTHPQANLPTSNNITEQAISRSKIRYKLTRGFKSKEAVLNFFYVTQYLETKQFNQVAAFC